MSEPMASGPPPIAMNPDESLEFGCGEPIIWFALFAVSVIACFFFEQPRKESEVDTPSEAHQGDFKSWAIVEVMGHSKYAGLVTDTTVAGAGMIRVDVPQSGDRPAFTKLLAPGSLFGITPCTEETARRAADSFRALPFAFFEPLRQLPFRDDSEDLEDY